LRRPRARRHRPQHLADIGWVDVVIDDNHVFPAKRTAAQNSPHSLEGPSAISAQVSVGLFRKRARSPGLGPKTLSPRSEMPLKTPQSILFNLGNSSRAFSLHSRARVASLILLLDKMN